MPKYEWFVIVSLIGFMFSIVGCDETQKMLDPVLPEAEKVEMPIGPADVLIYTRVTSWITSTDATAEAKITKKLLESKGIKVEITGRDSLVTDWMLQTKSNGSVNVLILYGVIPDTIYPLDNTLSDGSVAENWLETLDGDTILNHADYIAYHFSLEISASPGVNGILPLQNLMDIPVVIDVGQYDKPMYVTTAGSALTPSLVAFLSDRSFPLYQLQGEWYAEKIFAGDTGDTQAKFADPVILRDGDRGRLALVHQTQYEDNPKGEVAAEIIINALLTDKAVSVIVEPQAEETPSYSQYDVNKDGTVDNTDLTLVSVAIGQRHPKNPRLDINGNGIVDATDIILVFQNLDDTTPRTE